jgi:hypothetical protein
MGSGFWDKEKEKGILGESSMSEAERCHEVCQITSRIKLVKSEMNDRGFSFQ